MYPKDTLLRKYYQILAYPGQLIKEGQLRGEIVTQKDGYNKYGVSNRDTINTLSDIGITRKDSSIFQTIASIPEEKIYTENEIIINDDGENSPLQEIPVRLVASALSHLTQLLVVHTPQNSGMLYHHPGFDRASWGTW